MSRPDGVADSVLVIGCGLLGTSLGLACRRHGVTVWLEDRDSETLRTAQALGAGELLPPEAQPDLVVVCVPPAVLGECIVNALERFPQAWITDVGSVKAAPLAHVRARRPQDAHRYLGGHPMAGSERSGPLAASADLFEGRPWALTPHATTPGPALDAVKELAELTGATTHVFTPEEHDVAVARTSHLPHVMSALVAGRMVQAPEQHLALSGQGVRDVTRIAAGDPALWRQILSANAVPVTALLTQVRAELDVMLEALTDGDTDAVVEILSQGNRGRAAIPGKHGGVAVEDEPLYVRVPDRSGELARLLAEVDQIGVNIEDLRIDHVPGRPQGSVELRVAASHATSLMEALQRRGWSVQR